jgi:predicted DNA-binding protein (MmcQ/YjbR family)
MVTIQWVRKLALAFDGATEEPHFEKTSFRINKKIFATLDVVKNHAVIKLSIEDQGLFCSHNEKIIYPVKGGWGKRGYTVIELATIPKKLLSEMLKVAYETVSEK